MGVGLDDEKTAERVVLMMVEEKRNLSREGGRRGLYRQIQLRSASGYISVSLLCSACFYCSPNESE
jgi:hypothetical protein